MSYPNLVTVSPRKNIEVPIKELFRLFKSQFNSDFQQMANFYGLEYSTLSRNGVIEKIKNYEKSIVIEEDFLIQKDKIEFLQKQEKLNRLRMEEIHEKLIERLQNVIVQDEISLFSISPQELIVFIEKSQKILEYYNKSKKIDEQSKLTKFLGSNTETHEKDDIFL